MTGIREGHGVGGLGVWGCVTGMACLKGDVHRRALGVAVHMYCCASLAVANAAPWKVLQQLGAQGGA